MCIRDRCNACRDIDAGRFIDLLEIDAASNTGVDDVREVIDNAQYMPSRGRVKVYLIDDCLLYTSLRVLPGTHAAGRIDVEAIPALRRDRREAHCFADAGDLILMRPLLLHASSKAESPSGRRVLHVLFAPPEPGFGLRWRTRV